MALKNKAQLIDARCMKCDKLLGKLKGLAEIKCHKCGCYNAYEKK